MRDKGIEYIFSNKKVVKSGSLVEIYVFGKDFIIGRSQRVNKERKKQKSNVNKEESLKSSARRAKRTIKRLIMSNCFYWFKDNNQSFLPITLTLTFTENITDLKEANYRFTKFILRLNYEIYKTKMGKNKLKYLAVYELQKRGAIHYHMIFFNLPYIKNIYNKMRDIWGQGRIMVGGKNKIFNKIKDPNQLKNIIEYFTKYIQKSILENHFLNKKKYTTSKGLIKPIENSFTEVVNLIQSQIPEDALIYKYNGEDEYNKAEHNEPSFLRWFNYYQFDVSKYPELDKRLSDYVVNYNAGMIENVDF